MFLFFDTETTGFADFDKDLDDPAQPHVIQLACLLTDENGREVYTWKAPIQLPAGETIDEEGGAFKINQLSNELLEKYGVPMSSALAMFKSLEKRASLKIAHNYRFDGFLLKCAHVRNNMDQLEPPIDRYCTMKAFRQLKKDGLSVDNCKLGHLYQFVTGQELEGAHDALADVRAVKDIFFWLRENDHFEHQERYVPKEAA